MQPRDTSVRYPGSAKGKKDKGQKSALLRVTTHTPSNPWACTRSLSPRPIFPPSQASPSKIFARSPPINHRNVPSPFPLRLHSIFRWPHFSIPEALALALFRHQPGLLLSRPSLHYLLLSCLQAFYWLLPYLPGLAGLLLQNSRAFFFLLSSLCAEKLEGCGSGGGYVYCHFYAVY